VIPGARTPQCSSPRWSWTSVFSPLNSCWGQWAGSANRCRDRELGVTGKRRIFAPLYISCTALSHDAPAALLPPPFGSQLPHRILRSRPGVGSSVLEQVVTRL
jgi:hypothetical protein